MFKGIALSCIGVLLMLSGNAYGAFYTVTKTADTNDGVCDSDCSLREAVAVANGTPDNDTIFFAMPLFSSPQIITLSGSEIVIANNGTLSIIGTGAGRLTISGNNASRILVTSAGVVGSLSDVLLTAGNGVGAANTGRGGAFYNNGGTFTLQRVVIANNTAANGGGLNNAGTATLNIVNSMIVANLSTGAGGAMQNFSGNTMNIINSTIAGNTCNSTLTGGGAIQANGTLNVANSTFSGNTATGGDGGAFYYNGQGLNMTNTTIAGNTATGGGSGGLHKSTATLNANIRNSILAGNTGSASPDATGAFNSQGNNIIQTVGTSTGWVGSDLQNMNPLLSPLGSYGGVGLTHALLSGSPALNAGQNCVTDLSCTGPNPPLALTNDQRGAARAGNVDIGAFEDNGAYRALIPSARFNQSYTHVLTPNVGSFTYNATSGALPPGVTVNTGNVIASINGTPTQRGRFDFGITMTNQTNSAVVNYAMYVLDDLSIVPVTGRLTTISGQPVAAKVILIDQSGTSRHARSNGFGYFHFAQVRAGETYTVIVASKLHTFVPHQVTISDAVVDLNLVATL